MGHRLWVDDLSQTIRGSRKVIRCQMVECIVQTCEQLAQRRLKVADKSIIMCTNVQDTKAIVRA
eukprot:1845340-Pyramimonas_sp.AAC.1